MDFDGKTPTLETKEHHTESPKITSISHSSGDKLVKWDIDPDSGDTDLTLRSSSVSGTEVLSILYKATYTDDDDNTITIKATKNFTVHVLNKNSTVIGVDGTIADGTSAALDANFAQKTVKHETDTDAIANKTTAGNDTKVLTVYKATNGTDAKVVWAAQPTVVNGTALVDADKVPYTLKSSNSDIDLVGGKVEGKVTATVKNGASSGSITFTAEATPYGKSTDAALYDTKDVKVKSKIDKQILNADPDYHSIGKYKGKTYLYKSSGLDVANTASDIHKVDVSGLEINFDATKFATVDVVSADSASVTKVTGTVQNLKVNEGSVSTIDLDKGNVLVDTAKTGDITTDDGDVTVSPTQQPVRLMLITQLLRAAKPVIFLLTQTQ